MDEGTGVFWVCPKVESRAPHQDDEASGPGRASSPGRASDPSRTGEEGAEEGTDESPDENVESATAREAALAARFPERTGLIHGRMKAEEKQAAIAAFAGGAKPLLVATTVIEVGVDVPAAEIMVVEGAEHFGLAQLHQLRGRVGRGGAPGWCVLLYAPPLSEMARRRLEILREQDDGFVIAEQDLQLRGAGDAIGNPPERLPRLPPRGALPPPRPRPPRPQDGRAPSPSKAPRSRSC